MRCSVGPGLANLEQVVVVAHRVGHAGDPGIGVGIGHSDPGQRDVAGVRDRDRVVDQLARGIRHLPGHRLLDDIERGVGQEIAHQHAAVTTGGDGDIVATSRVTGRQDPHAGLIGQEVADLLCSQAVVDRVDIGRAEDFVNLVSFSAQQAGKLEAAIRPGDSSQFADVVLVVAIDIDEHGEASEPAFTRIADTITIQIGKLHAADLGGDNRVPFGKRAIVGRGGAELREQGHVRFAGGARLVEHGNREIEDIVRLALSRAFVGKDQRLVPAHAFRVEIEYEAEFPATANAAESEAGLVGIVNVVGEGRLCSRKEDLHFRQTDLRIGLIALVDVEIDDVIGFETGQSVQVEIDDRDVLNLDRIGVGVVHVGIIGVIFRLGRGRTVEADQRGAAIEVQERVEKAGAGGPVRLRFVLVQMLDEEIQIGLGNGVLGNICRTEPAITAQVQIVIVDINTRQVINISHLDSPNSLLPENLGSLQRMPFRGFVTLRRRVQQFAACGLRRRRCAGKWRARQILKPCVKRSRSRSIFRKLTARVKQIGMLNCPRKHRSTKAALASERAYLNGKTP